MIDRITLAVSDTEEMKAFYESVLTTKFYIQTFGAYQLYTARTGDREVLLCPKDIAGVGAEGNTVQIRFVPSDVQKAFVRGLASGGSEISPPEKGESAVYAGLRDPDGNSVEIIEYLGEAKKSDGFSRGIEVIAETH